MILIAQDGKAFMDMDALRPESSQFIGRRAVAISWKPSAQAAMEAQEGEKKSSFFGRSIGSCPHSHSSDEASD